MKKLQQFFIFSFSSKRLKKLTAKINCGIQEARINGELISIAESQLIRTLRQYTNNGFSQDKLNILLDKRNKLRKKKNNKDNIIKIKEYNKIIDEMLFIPEIISIKFNHTGHYKSFIKSGLFINGNKYVRFMAGAGHLRRSTVIFIKEELLEPIRNILENGMNKNLEINYGKYNAYFGLYSSSSIPVSRPRFVVIPDKEITKVRKVDFVEDDDETVTEKEIPITNNIFDGQGLISIDFAKKWSEDLGLDYDAVSFIVRAPFIKGLLVSFPFHTYAKENQINTVIDIYGNSYDIKEIDVILTESQFKMKSYYNNLNEHLENSLNNNLEWGVTRVNPKKEKEHFFSSYQYIQVLKDSVNIKNLTKDTINYFNDVSVMDFEKSLIYMMGDSFTKENFDFERIENPIVKAMMMNDFVIKDPHVKNYIAKTLNKKIRESYTGKLLFRGNYQFIVFDPYALTQHALGLEPIGLLPEGNHYSEYWNEKESNNVVSGRSPLTWKTELNKLNFINNKETKKWFSHLYSGIIFNIHGTDTMMYADADGDGDSIFTTDNEEMVNNVYIGNPVTYNKRVASKRILDYDGLPVSDMDSFNSKIGLITNYSTTYYSMQSLFDKDSLEYKTINDRLIACRKFQGSEIDKTKGLLVNKPPEWSRWKNNDELGNKILTDKRPFWMQYLYPHKKYEWDNHYKIYNIYSYTKWGLFIDELLVLESPNKEQKKIIEKFKRYSPLLFGASGVMDRVFDEMINSIKEIRIKIKLNEFDYTIYKSKKQNYNTNLKEEMYKLIRQYNKMRKDLYLSKDMEQGNINIVEFIKNKAFEISSDLTELTDMAIDICYAEKKSNYEFCWQIFSDGILENMNNKFHKIKYPILDKNGKISFLNRNYRIIENEK